MTRKRRTRTQKQQARHEFTFTLGGESISVPVPVSKKHIPDEGKNLFHYDTALIKADLTKTVVLSILAIGAIVSLFLMGRI